MVRVCSLPAAASHMVFPMSVVDVTSLLGRNPADEKRSPATSATNWSASPIVATPNRSRSSWVNTDTDAGVVLTGWGRRPGTTTSGSLNVGGSGGGGSGTCAHASWIEGTAITTTTHKNPQRPTRPLGP